ncbi:MAG: bifunctional phosphoribosyl-AMP cyclohydrolase/phosphoribosyl-ATP diphosphatase HisIE [Chloroflexota bacterium]
MTGPGLRSPAGALGDPADVRYGPAGLVPVVVQDAGDGRILMLAWANAEAVAASIATGDVHFFSRARARLWRKGETSGNVLRLVDLALDCDGDALLARVVPAGPTCHRGERSCFDPDGAAGEAGRGAPPDAGPEAAQGFAWLETLWSTIADRAARLPEGSYTARLLAAGVDGPARKVAEEAVELLMVAKDDAAVEAAGRDRAATREALAGEAADLVYHALVLLAERGVPPATVLGRLRARHGG